MSMLKFIKVSRKALLLASLALGLAQTGCAHPVVMEPSVVVSSRMGHAPVYAQLGVPGRVLVLPPVVYAPPPPPVLYAPPMYRPAPAWGHGHWHHGWRGRGDGHHGRH